jgi:CheY-like chemotaxis protein
VVLSNISLIRRLLAQATPDERVTKRLDSMQSAADRGAKLTAQLLAFARSQRIQLQPLLACELILGLRELLARTLGPMITLVLDGNPAPVPVLADPTQVEMMVLNLAINARDAMPDGGTLTIATRTRHLAGEQDASDGDYVEIAVHDTGIGMDAQTLRRAMEPFFTTKPLGKGTGLGLAQIYGSARQSGGTVRIESAVGEGTTVRVLLPCTALALDADAPARDESDLPAPPMRVLLVDDDAAMRGIVASALEADGNGVRQVADGAAALAALESVLPDVVIADFAMPGMNGAELARRILARWPALPIVFASGFADTDAIEAVMGQGVRVLRKPFRIADLRRAIQAATAP